MKTTLFLPLFLFLSTLALTGVQAQEAPDSTRIWLIETTDGNQYFGTIISRNTQEIHLRTESLGVIIIQVKDLKSIREIRPELIRDGELWRENPQATRYFWAPNGYGLRKGEGYYQNIWVFFNQVSVGISDNLSIGAGMVPLFLFAGGPTPVWITPKISIPVAKDAFNLGAGALLGTVIGEGDATFGILYGVGTFGTRDKNVNIGLGYGFLAGEWARTPLIEVSGMLRISRLSYLLSENYFLNAGGETFAVMSLGGRTVWSKIALDYGLFLPVAEDTGFFASPWLGISVPFGRKTTE